MPAGRVGRVEHSSSTWRPPPPPAATVARAAVLDAIVARIATFGARRVRVAVDGPTAAGKSTLADEVAQRIAVDGRNGRVALRASLDDFKRPWRDAHRYDRTSGEGYYRNAYDVDAARRLLLDPAGPNGSGRVVLCSIDPITQVDHSAEVVDTPADGVLIVDGVFAFRPPLDDCWDLRIWLAVDPDDSLRRSVERDAAMEGGAAAAEALLRDRYLVAERCYVAEFDPAGRADIVVDNRDVERPLLVRG